MLREQVAAALTHAGFMEVQAMPTPAVVAVSGGRDSVALLHLLLEAAPHLPLHVAHLDHGLRPESADDAAFVADLAARLRLPCSMERLVPAAMAGEPGGPENSARRLRYRFLLRTSCNAAGPSGVPVLLLGHHADDQLETMLLHLVRGAGLQGLTGMQPESWLAGRAMGAVDDSWADRPVRVLRPLLSVDPGDLAHYAAYHGLPWREDSSNRDESFARNRLRHVVLPALRTLNPEAAQAAGRTARLLTDEWARIQQLDRSALAALLVEPAGMDALDTTASLRRIRLDLATLREQDGATRRGVIRLALRYLGARETEWHHIDRIAAGIDHDDTADSNRGPHPVMGNLAWSICRPPRTTGGSQTGSRETLSIHYANALPMEPAQPLLTSRRAPLAVPARGILAVEGGWALHCRTVSRDACPQTWDASSPWEGWFDAAAITAPTLTTVSPGMRMAPLGMKGRHRTVGDMFTDCKVHPTLRPHWPILVDEATGIVHWLCGVRTAEESKIGPQTSHILHLHWKPGPVAGEQDQDAAPTAGQNNCGSPSSL